MNTQIRMLSPDSASGGGKGVQGGSHEQHVAAGKKGGSHSTGEKKKADANDGRHDNPGRPKGSKNK